MPVRWVTPVVAAMLLASSCASGYRYVKNSEARTYFKVPHDWELFDQEDILRSQGKALSPQAAEQAKKTQWVVAFDGDPSPSLKHLFDARTDHLSGIVRVRSLSASERDGFSLSSLRTELLQADPVEQASAGNANVEVLRSEDVTRPGGFRGNRMVANLRRSNGSFVTVDQTALVDSKTQRVYLLMIGCEARCYVENIKVVKQIADSWTVKQK